jgi:hypothetical protein
MSRMPRELYTQITTLLPPSCAVRLTALAVAQDHVAPAHDHGASVHYDPGGLTSSGPLQGALEKGIHP